MDIIRIPEIVTATHGRLCGQVDEYRDIFRVVIDSREVQSGDLFWALPGSRHDGHEFIEDARVRGACACVCSRSWSGNSSLPIIRVGEPLQALQDFANWYRRHKSAQVIGVTGSVGKTTTRNMIDAVLSARWSGTRSPKNYTTILACR